MRKSQQATSRKRSAKINRLQALNRTRRRWWKAMVLSPLTQAGKNTRAERRLRMGELMDRPWVRLPASRAPAETFRCKIWSPARKRMRMGPRVPLRESGLGYLMKGL